MKKIYKKNEKKFSSWIKRLQHNPEFKKKYYLKKLFFNYLKKLFFNYLKK